MHFMDVKKSIKLSSFVISSCFKDSAFTAVKRDSNFVAERDNICQKTVNEWVPFLSKMVYKRVRDWTSRRSLPA